MSNYKMFCVSCVACSSLTSKSFARANGGKCKACATGVAKPEPKSRCKCAKCGAAVELKHERAWQEYPGASVQGGYDWYECAKCGHYDDTPNLGGYNIRENARGW